MEYLNQGKRDILLFPKFENLDLIQKIRLKYDKLAEIIQPHITLVFPFNDEISNEELIEKIKKVIEQYSEFRVEFSGVALSKDNYIYLNCIKGKEIIIKLHDELYEKVVPTHYKSDIEYIPHITLGQAENIDEFDNFDYAFTTSIGKVIIEQIGTNEESIIIEELEFSKK